MTTKMRPAKTVNFVSAYSRSDSGDDQSWVTTIHLGQDTITYEDGRKSAGKWPWKSCVHSNKGSASPGGSASWLFRSSRDAVYGGCTLMPLDPIRLGSIPSVPSSMVDETLKMSMDQIDLNTSNAVLLYSGVLQAVPLLGSVFKFNQIMRKVSRHLSKRLRKKPFTTVVKDLIAADFIDRFVISPTLADVRKFQDATDYTLRVLSTARERNSHAFALSSSNKVELSRSEGTGSFGGGYGNDPIIGYTEVITRSISSKAFMLLEAEYNMTAVDPISVWAQRVGLTRPLDSVWDLVPFSFVVDYFTRAGDFISHLSDEMSSIDGLKGKITSLKDVWYTTTGTVECNRTPSGIISEGDYGRWWNLESLSYDSGTAKSAKTEFVRSRVSNAWGRCMQLMSRPEDYLTVNLDLSQTRKRTLAELVIQAKL